MKGGVPVPNQARGIYEPKWKNLIDAKLGFLSPLFHLTPKTFNHKHNILLIY